MNAFLLLLIAIILEVIGTAALKYSNGFTKFLPSALMIVSYGISFYLFSISLKKINLGAAYAIWSGVGTAGTILISLLLLKEKIDLPMAIGILLISAGVVIISFFSKTVHLV